jgi:hypothetical protein
MNGGTVQCRDCKTALTGTKNNEFFQLGKFVHLISRDSPDCNWHRCASCRDTLCNTCYMEQTTFCCDGDAIAWRERAQMLADREQANIPNTTEQEELMSDHKIVYLIVERGVEPNRQVYWRSAGNAFVCRDGSLNVRLDIHPGLTFNIREPRSNGEREEAQAFPNVGNGNGNNHGHSSAVTQLPDGKAKVTATAQTSAKSTADRDDDIPF